MMICRVLSWTMFVLIASLGPASIAGCDRNVRLADKDVRDVTVQTVTHFDITLDQQASPEQTAFVFLKAIRDDFLATDEAERKKALGIQFDLTAADVIAARNPTSLSRNEILYETVTHWTPAVSHYARDFETEWENANSRFVRVGPKLVGTGDSDIHECQILMEVRDAGGEAGAQVLLAIGLIQDGGYWRVTQVGFLPDARVLPTRANRTNDAVSVVSPSGE